jgi:hypothetical protein
VCWGEPVWPRISLNGDTGALVVARRVPGESHVRWLVILDRGLDRADPCVRAELESALTDLRALTGLEQVLGSQPGAGRSESARLAVGSDLGADGLVRQICACGAIKKRCRASYLDVKSRGC